MCALQSLVFVICYMAPVANIINLHRGWRYRMMSGQGQCNTTHTHTLHTGTTHYPPLHTHVPFSLPLYTISPPLLRHTPHTGTGVEATSADSVPDAPNAVVGPAFNLSAHNGRQA